VPRVESIDDYASWHAEKAGNFIDSKERYPTVFSIVGDNVDCTRKDLMRELKDENNARKLVSYSELSL
jgi:hypothetical protein